jgi:hypothetical protein
MTMTPAKLRKACDKVGAVYLMARLLGKGHPPQYLYQRINRKVAISEMDALAIRKAIELASERGWNTKGGTQRGRIYFSESNKESG